LQRNFCAAEKPQTLAKEEFQKPVHIGQCCGSYSKGHSANSEAEAADSAAADKKLILRNRFSGAQFTIQKPIDTRP